MGGNVAVKKKIVFLALGCLISMFFISGCALNFFGGSDELQAGYYKEVVMQPNGKFIGKDKIDDKKAAESGLVYKVEMNEQKQVAKITAMYHEQPIDAEWFDTTYSCYGNFAVVAMEYQEGYVKYSFKNARMQPHMGYYGSYSLRYKLDEKKNPTIVYCYNKEGEQKENDRGFAQMLFTYDDKGFLIKVGYANGGGERVITTYKEYEINLKYDKNAKKNSLPVEVSNLGKDGELMLNSYSTAKKTYKYDDKNRLIEIRHFGTDGNLRERTPLDQFYLNRMVGGIGAGAITKYKYEGEQNRPNEVSFYGKDEQPIGIKTLDNASSVKIKSDKLGNITEFSFFGTDGLPRALDDNKFGKEVVVIKIKRDEFGNIIEVALYNKDGNLAAAKGGKAAIERFKYDEKRQQIEASYFGTSDEPIEITDKEKLFHKKTMEYNDDGILTKTTYYDKEGREIGSNQPNADNQLQIPVQSNSGMNKFYGKWYMNGPTTADSGAIEITEREVIRIPLHDADRIPKNTWKRNAYTVNSVNVNPDTGAGYAILKFDDGSVNKFTLYSTSSMTWDKAKYTWKRQ